MLPSRRKLAIIAILIIVAILVQSAVYYIIFISDTHKYIRASFSPGHVINTQPPLPTGSFPPLRPIQRFIPPLNESQSIESLLDRSVNIPYSSGLVDKIRGSQYPHQYSRFRCIGDDNSDLASADRACVFMNLCYDRYTETFNYYRKNKRPVLYDAHKGLIYDFKSYAYGFVYLTYFEHHAWAPHVIEDTLPSQDVTHIKRLHVLFRHWIPQYMNLGVCSSFTPY